MFVLNALVELLARGLGPSAPSSARRARIEYLFPSLPFRRAYDALSEHLADAWKADLEYLRILHLAASTMESEVERAVVELLAAGRCPDAELVKRTVATPRIEVPEMAVPTVDLSRYDGLPGEVLVSQAVRDLARTSAGVAFEELGERELKRVSEPVRVYEVRWRE